jgi:hypothetical protein
MAENSGVTVADIEEALRTRVEATHVEIEDLSGTSTFYVTLAQELICVQVAVVKCSKPLSSPHNLQRK